jgi:hypothetical protein
MNASARAVAIPGLFGRAVRPCALVYDPAVIFTLNQDRGEAITLRGPQPGSPVRISNIVAVEKKIIRRVLGAIHADDLLAVDRGLRAALAL